jgi:hypothetical protein
VIAFYLAMLVLPAAIIAAAVVLARLSRNRLP